MVSPRSVRKRIRHFLHQSNDKMKKRCFNRHPNAAKPTEN